MRGVQRDVKQRMGGSEVY